MSDSHDPKGVIAESYRIAGISAPECRSIFVDWALSVDPAIQPAALRALLARHGAAAPDHPMTAVLREGLEPPPPPRRRGGRAGRRQ